MRKGDAPSARLRSALSRRRAFFTADYRQVTERNVRNVTAACLIVLAMLTLLTPTAWALLPSWEPSAGHFASIPVAAALSIVMLVTGPRVRTRPYAGAALCLTVEAILLALIIMLDTVFANGRSGVLLQPVGIGLGILIALPWGLPLWVLGAADVTFVLLSLWCKPLVAAQIDGFSVFVGFIVAVAVAELALALRLQDFETRERYRVLSERDGLTGLLNKGSLVTFAVRAVERLASASGMTVIVVDVDDFKRVNDSFGHDVGDEVLRAIADELSRAFRSSDGVGRFGGDEFMVVAPGLAREEVVTAKVNAVLARIAAATERCAGEPVTTSAGAVVVPAAAFVRDAPAVTYEMVFRQADQALYAAKNDGKARLAVRSYAPASPTCDRRAASDARGHSAPSDIASASVPISPDDTPDTKGTR